MFLRFLQTHRFLPPPGSPSFITNEGKHPRSSRGQDKGDHRSCGIEKKDPGHIGQDLNRFGSGQAGEGLGRGSGHSPGCFLVLFQVGPSQMSS